MSTISAHNKVADPPPLIWESKKKRGARPRCQPADHCSTDLSFSRAMISSFFAGICCDVKHVVRACPVPALWKFLRQIQRSDLLVPRLTRDEIFSYCFCCTTVPLRFFGAVDFLRHRSSSDDRDR
jgi:hypothetical protein